MPLRARRTSFMQTSETYMIGGVPAPINSAIPPIAHMSYKSG